jgi:hypothetical protein
MVMEDHHYEEVSFTEIWIWYVRVIQLEYFLFHILCNAETDGFIGSYLSSRCSGSWSVRNQLDMSGPRKTTRGQSIGRIVNMCHRKGNGSLKSWTGNISPQNHALKMNENWSNF